MADAITLPTTQRAYTLRLRRAPGECRHCGKNDCACWREALWATHEAVNKGAKVFGDWLLTLRGGLDHRLADEGPLEQRRARRILLALSWLSVEDERGAPPDLIVAYGDKCVQNQHTQESRDRTVEKALRGILSDHVAPDEIDSWVHDCEGSLKVRIRDDAVWVNRRKGFDCKAEQLNGALTQDAVWDLLKPVFGSPEKMLAPAALAEEEDQTDNAAFEGRDDETASLAVDTVSEQVRDDELVRGGTIAKDFVKKAGKWLSLRYKAEGGADYSAVAERYERIAQALHGVQGAVAGGELIDGFAKVLGRAGGGRNGIVQALGYTGAKQKGSFFSRLNEIESTKKYTAGDLQPLLESTRKRRDDLRKISTGRQANPKGPRPWSIHILRDVADACGFQYDPITSVETSSEQGSAANEKTQGGANHGEYSVILDHAMRRVSVAHSWIKRAEATRAKCESDRSRIDRVSTAVRDWLDEFFSQRGTVTNAADGYSVRRRALGGKHANAWKAVVAAWTSCAGEEERRKAVGQVQADWDEDQKFGHSDLFVALADNDAVVVWKDGPQALIDYIAAKDAESRMRRYKVPAYRHPDPNHHPVFTDFGYSRWRVEYEAHQVRYRAAKAELAINEKQQELASHAADDTAKKKAGTALKSAETRLKKARGEVTRLGCSAKIRLKLWTGREFAWSDELFGGITWHSSRLREDLMLNPCTDTRPTKTCSSLLTRADRLGRASARANDGDGLIVANVFSEDHWNARLQAPRRELEELAKRVDKGKKPGMIRWFVTYSPRLEARGPFVEYAQNHGVQLDQKRDGDRQLILAAPEPKTRKRNEWRGLAYPFWHPEHKEGTTGHAKILLSRLRGLRVLSVDLGHRFAAACAVWESLDAQSFDIRGTIDTAKADGARIQGSPDGLYVHVIRKRTKEKRGKIKEIEETTVYRRTGEDFLRDPKTGRPTTTRHPAPWARLDRQFSIRVQGEQLAVRAALTSETAMVTELANSLGLIRENLEARRSRTADELMRRAARIATLGLKRHGRRAKIAYAFKPDCPGIPGIGGKLKEITHGDEAHVQLLTNALMDWHALGIDTDWDGAVARGLWKEHIKAVPGGFEIGDPRPLAPDAERPTRQERRKSEEELRERLKPIAEFFANSDPTTTQTIHEAWAKLWGMDDGIERATNDFEHRLIRDAQGKTIGSRTSPRKGKESPGGWHERLRTITDWIMGWHLPGARSGGWKRNVGGLSLTRIATMKSLYQLHKAFTMRPRPHELRGAPKKGESNAGVAESILYALERMREQRVKQIASRIAAAALGLAHPFPVGSRDQEKRLERHERLGKLRQRFPLCHAIVIENLRNYHPDELQSRRENKALMNWSAGKIRKYLEEACQLHGLHLREVMPNYTSRQCSRTGLPGERCAEVPVADFLDKPLWRKAVKRAKERKKHPTKDKPFDAEAGLLLALDAEWPDRANVPEAERPAYAEKVKDAKPLRLIRKGGDLFVAAPPESCKCNAHPPCSLCDGKRALQADFNAAANIGLRALLDPEFPGKWWYVPCAESDGVPRADKVKGSTCFGQASENIGSLLPATEPNAAVADPVTAEGKAKPKVRRRQGRIRGSSAAKREITNFWADPSTNPLRSASHGGVWRRTPSYWCWVRQRVVAALRRLNALTESPVSDLAPVDDDDVPF